VFIVFVTTLAAGLLGVLAMCRMNQVGWKFVRLIGIFALCLLIPVVASFALWGGWRRGFWPITAGALTTSASLAAFIILGLAPMSRRYGTTIRVFAAIGGMTAIAAAWAWGFDCHLWPGQSPWVLKATLAGQALSALLIGSVSLAAALGHAYLTHTTMTIHPLRRLASIFATALTFRIAWLVLALGWLYWRGSPGLPLFLDLLRSEWLMLVVRCGVGLFIPAIFAYMVTQTVRLRSTQSATGIFYFTLVLVFVGELAALHLVGETHLPF
jgi:hypothetical protein